MSRYLANRRVQVDAVRQPIRYIDDEDNASETFEDAAVEGSIKFRPPKISVPENRSPPISSLPENPAPPIIDVSKNQEPFMGIKMRRKASLKREYRGDYLHVPSRPCLMKILERQGDNKVLFADRVLKFTASGKMKKRGLIITDFAIYIIDPDTDALKRRIALAAVEKISLSELSDNFFAIIIPTEYDILMASTRKTEIVTVLGEATKSASDYELEVFFSNSFEYHAAADLVKEVHFEEVEGGVKTRIVRK